MTPRGCDLAIGSDLSDEQKRLALRQQRREQALRLSFLDESIECSTDICWKLVCVAASPANRSNI